MERTYLYTFPNSCILLNDVVDPLQNTSLVTREVSDGHINYLFCLRILNDNGFWPFALGESPIENAKCDRQCPCAFCNYFFLSSAVLTIRGMPSEFSLLLYEQHSWL